MTNQPNPRCGGTPGKPASVVWDGPQADVWTFCPGCFDCQPTTPSGAGDARCIAEEDSDDFLDEQTVYRCQLAAGHDSAHEWRSSTGSTFIWYANVATQARIRAESAAEVERLTAELRDVRQVAAEDEVALVNLANRAQAAEQRLREVEEERDRLRALDGPTMAEYEALVEAFREVDAALDPWLHGERIDPRALSSAMAKAEWLVPASRPVPASPAEEAR